VFFPLKLEEAEAIRAFHDVSWRHLRPFLTEKEIQTLRNLEKDIEQCLIQNSTNGVCSFFLRLCGRSPKDGEPFNRNEILQKYNDALYIIQNSPNPEIYINDSNQKMNAISQISWLKVDCAKDAMSLLLTSERVYADMIDWIKFGEPEQLCFRRYFN
jgi:hypothetical protein